MHTFSSPVYVRTDRAGLHYRVDHVQAAAEQLVKWTKRGPRWHKAVNLCQSALEGDPIDPQIIRKAFEAADKEATMLFPPDQAALLVAGRRGSRRSPLRVNSKT